MRNIKQTLEFIINCSGKCFSFLECQDISIGFVCPLYFNCVNSFLRDKEKKYIATSMLKRILDEEHKGLQEEMDI